MFAEILYYRFRCMLSLTHDAFHSFNIRSACNEWSCCRPWPRSCLRFNSWQIDSCGTETTLRVPKAVSLCTSSALLSLSRLWTTSKNIRDTLSELLQTASSDRWWLVDFAVKFFEVRFIEFGLRSKAGSGHLFADTRACRQVLHNPTYLHFEVSRSGVLVKHEAG